MFGDFIGLNGLLDVLVGQFGDLFVVQGRSLGRDLACRLALGFRLILGLILTTGLSGVCRSVLSAALSSIFISFFVFLWSNFFPSFGCGISCLIALIFRSFRLGLSLCSSSRTFLFFFALPGLIKFTEGRRRCSAK